MWSRNPILYSFSQYLIVSVFIKKLSKMLLKVKSLMFSEDFELKLEIWK